MFVGDGFSEYPQLAVRLKLILNDTISDLYPHAASICVLAENAFQQKQTITAEELLPIYLRDQWR